MTFSKNVEEALAAGIYSLIECEGQHIGALAVERDDTHIQLTQICVLPSHPETGRCSWPRGC